jgi:hypothetical protein
MYLGDAAAEDSKEPAALADELGKSAKSPSVQTTINAAGQKRVAAWLRSDYCNC